MKLQLILFLAVFLIISACKSKTDVLKTSIKEYVANNFVNSECTLDIKNDSYHLHIITDEAFSEELANDKITQALGKLYEVFYNNTNSAATSSAFRVTIENNEKTWETKEYNMFEMGEMFEFE